MSSSVEVGIVRLLTLLSLLLWVDFASAKSRSCSGQSSSGCPIQLNPSEIWVGNDGRWSAFPVQIGTPPQTILAQFTWSSGQVLVNTNSSCIQSPASSTSYCPDPKTLFRDSDTSTLQRNDSLKFSIPDRLNGVVVGYDNLTLASSPYAVQIGHQLLLSANETQLFQAQIGLGDLEVKAVSESETVNFLSSLTMDKIIPNRTWGYKQGAYYRDDPGALTLGGVDTTQFRPNKVVFDNSKGDFMVRLRSLGTSAKDADPLLPTQINIKIVGNDSMIRLPKEVCQNLEKTFGLVYDGTVKLYTVNDQLRTKLKSQNPTFTFSIQDLGASGGIVDIQLPFAAFDQKAGPPFVSTETNYFSISCEGEPVLGRTFLQEAYLAANYEDRTFQVFQTNKGRPPGFASGKIAGIAIGGAVVLGLFIAGSYEYLSRMHRKKRLSKNPQYRFSMQSRRRAQSMIQVESPKIITKDIFIKPSSRRNTGHFSPLEYHPTSPLNVNTPYFGPSVVIPDIQHHSARSSVQHTDNTVSATSTHPVIIDASQQSPIFSRSGGPQAPRRASLSHLERSRRISMRSDQSIVATRHRSLGLNLGEPKVLIPPRYYSPSTSQAGSATRRASEGQYYSPPPLRLATNTDVNPATTVRRQSRPNLERARHSSMYSARSPVSPLTRWSTRYSFHFPGQIVGPADGLVEEPEAIDQNSTDTGFNGKVQNEANRPPGYSYGRRWSHLSR